MTPLLVLWVVAAAPAEPPTFTELPGPLGATSGLVGDVPLGGEKAGERRVTVQPNGCATQRSVDLARFLQGTLFALNQVQSWLDGQPGAEARIFKQKGTLGEVAKLSAGAAPAPERLCGAGLRDGYKLDLTRAPPRKCRAAPQKTLADHWWTHAGKPAAVVHVAPPDRKDDACGVRLSAVLFDQTGAARFRYHADLRGPPVATLLGDGCLNLDFQAQESGAYKAITTTCKR